MPQVNLFKFSMREKAQVAPDAWLVNFSTSSDFLSWPLQSFAKLKPNTERLGQVF